jgi:hypothetical protein
MSTYPALDFLREVEIWQTAPGGTAGLAVALPDSENITLAGLLTQVRNLGQNAELESRARYWLIGYRQMSPPLTDAQRTRLDGVIDRDPQWWPPAGPPPRAKVPIDRNKGRFWTARRIRAAVIGAVAGLVLGIGTAGVWHAVGGSGNGAPPAAGAPAGPAQQIPAVATDLQRFRADWNAPAAASADAGDPAGLVLLQDGLYYPVPWGVRAGDPGWQPDTTGSVTATVQGHQADVTDSDGTTWTVAIGQPFVLSPNPQVVFRILRDAAVQSMPQPHAIVVRYPVQQKG